MNGIFHECSQQRNLQYPLSDDELFERIYAYTDIIIRQAAPKKLIYFALDGVSPQAKFQAQRRSRFKKLIQAQKDFNRQEKLIAQVVGNQKGWIIIQNQMKYDRTRITPGTDFMYQLSAGFKNYLIERASYDANWFNLTLVWSDAFVPGEGEHKILDFMRSQRAQPGYDPNQHHCIYGLDADLIILSLTLHEPQIFVLREAQNFENNIQSPENNLELQYVRIGVLRQYLLLEFQQKLPFKLEIERIVDDFVFLTFFLGNDFFPALPGFHIINEGLEILIQIYKNLLPSIDGYLVQDGKLVQKNVELLFKKIADVEEEQFRNYHYIKILSKQFSVDPDEKNQRLSDLFVLNCNQVKQRSDITFPVGEAMLKQLIQKESIRIGEFEKAEQLKSYVDKVQLHKSEWKVRHYMYKFKVSASEVKECAKLVKQNYLEGLQWLLNYYYIGCASWDWFYAFNYAPFASDLVNFSDVQINFDIGQPCSPFELLMSINPQRSIQYLPKCYHSLLLDSSSPIIDFYPLKFCSDLNGELKKWMSVTLLPFVDKKRLIKAMREVDNNLQKLTVQETQRNEQAPILVICAKNERTDETINQITQQRKYCRQIDKSQLSGILEKVTILQYNHPEYTQVSNKILNSQCFLKSVAQTESVQLVAGQTEASLQEIYSETKRQVQRQNFVTIKELSTADTTKTEIQTKSESVSKMGVVTDEQIQKTDLKMSKDVEEYKNPEMTDEFKKSVKKATASDAKRYQQTQATSGKVFSYISLVAKEKATRKKKKI